jgi:transcription termination factor Rho
LKIRARFGLHSIAGRWLNATGAHRLNTRGVPVSVLDRSALEDSPLADLHAIASELSIDGYRRLRRPALIDAILDRQEGGERQAVAPRDSPGAEAEAKPKAAKPRPTRRRSAKPAASDQEPVAAASDQEPVAAASDQEPVAADDDRPAVAEAAVEPAEAEPAEAKPAEVQARVDDESPADADEDVPAPRRRRGRRGGRSRTTAREESPSAEEEEEHEEAPSADQGADEEIVEGVVELLANGSGFVRVDPPEPSDDDVYVSAAQVKRCELVTGDKVAGPKRAPRRSERFASLTRIDMVNDRPAVELADSVRFDDLPAALPTERFQLGSEDPTVKAIERLTPFGKGSRVTITGPARAGKSEAFRRLAEALTGHQDLTLMVVLAGVRPEEVSEWDRGPLTLTAGISFAASADAQANTIEPVIDQGRRLAARGADVVVMVDTLDGLHEHAVRKTLAAARNIVQGGSLTVIATASAEIGGETTVVALDAELASTGRFPAVDLADSGTIRPELLIGEEGAEAIAGARIEAREH